jgi:hypothetical protein
MGIAPENIIVLELSLSYSTFATFEPIVIEFLHDMGGKIRETLCKQGFEDMISSWSHLGYISTTQTKARMCLEGIRSRM